MIHLINELINMHPICGRNQAKDLVVRVQLEIGTVDVYLELSK